jgi:hypothetical protein
MKPIIEIVVFESYQPVCYGVRRTHKILWFKPQFEFLGKYSRVWFYRNKDDDRIPTHCRYTTYEEAKKRMDQYNNPHFEYGVPLAGPPCASVKHTENPPGAE